MVTHVLSVGYPVGVGGLVAAGFLGSLWLGLVRWRGKTPGVARLLLGSVVRTATAAGLLVTLTADAQSLALATGGFLGVRHYVLWRVVRRGRGWS